MGNSPGLSGTSKSRMEVVERIAVSLCVQEYLRRPEIGRSPLYRRLYQTALAAFRDLQYTIHHERNVDDGTSRFPSRRGGRHLR